jgi:hypothetical protein
MTKEPSAFLAFDEAHTMMDVITDVATNIKWTKFASFRRAFRALRSFPIWSFFLSTTGKFDQFASAPGSELSSRIVMGMLVSVMPFSALGFDHLAQKFCADGSMNLEKVTSLQYRLSLGRPL